MAEREGMLKAIRRIEFETRLHSFLLAFLVIMLFFPTLALLLAALEDNRRNPGSWAFDIVMLVLPTVLTLLVYKASKRKYMRQLRDYSFLAALAAGHDAGREAANSDHWLIRMIQPQRK